MSTIAVTSPVFYHVPALTQSRYELPPTQRALPLSSIPTKPKGGKGGKGSKGKPKPIPATEIRLSKKQRKKNSEDDAPRAFKRLMAFTQGQKFRSGLDDGTKGKPAPTNKAAAVETPTIRPGEDIRSFAARVDASLPISGLSTKQVVKDGKDVNGMKVQRTRKERKMHKLYDQWRAEEAKIQDQRDELKEQEEEKQMDDEAAGISVASIFGELETEPGTKSGKKKKGKRVVDDDDPWAELKKKRGEAAVGLHDVAKAPPELHKKTSKLLKIANNATVNVGSAPKAAGSLRRREEIEENRQQVMEAYRKIREHEQRKLDDMKKK